MKKIPVPKDFKCYILFKFRNDMGVFILGYDHKGDITIKVEDDGKLFFVERQNE
jgi:hypothetical protein